MASSTREQHATTPPPTQVVQALFTALGNPDRREVLALLTDDVEWWVAGPPQIPYAGTFRGRDDVARFFAAFDGAIDYESWDAQQVIAEGDTVVVLGDERWRGKASGRAVDNPWALVITVRDGQIARFRAYEDTAASRDAFLPDPASG
jgi:ketosteroid isomerase-like protein